MCVSIQLLLQQRLVRMTHPGLPVYTWLAEFGSYWAGWQTQKQYEFMRTVASVAERVKRTKTQREMAMKKQMLLEWGEWRSKHIGGSGN
jgi:hypothetical protein